MKPILILFAICALLGMGSVAQAQDSPEPIVIPAHIQPSTTKGPFYYNSDAELRARKFARGLANVVLCPAEVPNQMFQEAYKTSPVTGVVVGFFKGVYRGGERFFVGWWEMATFYFPGNNNYQPYIEPEVVFQEYTH